MFYFLLSLMYPSSCVLHMSDITSFERPGKEVYKFGADLIGFVCLTGCYIAQVDSAYTKIV